MVSPLGSHVLQALTPQTATRCDHSRCVRHRCHRNECLRCIEVCQRDAISWSEQGLTVSPGSCTQCLRCLSVCPTAALQSPELSLLQVFADLATHPEPVLGCAIQSASAAHARLPCLGYLAHPELLLVLALVFRDGIQVNLSGCGDCPNGPIRKEVQAAHAGLVKYHPEHQVELVITQKKLNYQPSSVSRRELFGLINQRSTRTAKVMVERLQVASSRKAYGRKQVPPLRALLLKAIEPLPEAEQRMAELLFGEIAFTSTCTACNGCVGVCPIGAIDPAENDTSPPGFERRYCVACGSCQAFCRKQGVQLTADPSPRL